MKNRNLLLSIALVGMALGTAWAVRGRFGHEQGAAWAGAIGVLCLVLVAKRKDWYQKSFKIALAAAAGWGISGVISYGLIVGYGRGTDFVNVYYGLLMLFVIGVLYGFIGGGLVGMALVDSRQNKIPWHRVLTEMIAFGLLTYGVLVMQFQWLMTPPRSEMWAACLGGSVAVGWFVVRNQYRNILKVSVCSALGAGFGFAFGNFLQVMGRVAEIDFNFWNVMEYSIGFFGGAGMAYGVFTSAWPSGDERVEPRKNVIPIFLVTLFIPFVVWDQSFTTRKLTFLLEKGGTESTIFAFKFIAIAAIVCVALYMFWRNASSRDNSLTVGTTRRFFILHTSLYIFLSFLVTGILAHPLEQYLYVVNLLVILYLIPKANPATDVAVEFKVRNWIGYAGLAIVFIALLAFIAINSHEGLWGSNVRFEW